MKHKRIVNVMQSSQVSSDLERKKPTKRQIMKQSTYDLLSKSSISFTIKALNKENNKFLRIFWAVFILGSVSVCGFYFVLNVQSFLSFGVITSINQVAEAQPEFPTVSIDDSGFDIEIINLSFNLKNLTNEAFGSKNFLEWYNDPFYNKCLRFNSGFNSTPILRSFYPGYEFGLKLDFNYRTSYYFGQIIVHVHNQTAAPNSLYEYGDFVSAVKRIFDRKLPHPYNECYENVSLFSINKTLIYFMKNANTQYTQTECVYLCTNLKYMEERPCNCTLNSLNDFQPDCKSPQDEQCQSEYFERLATKDQIQLCSDYCPLQCETLIYDITQKVQPMLITNMSSPEQVNQTKNFYSLRVYYEMNEMTVISQSPQQSIFNLVSNIGGTFSLFLGLSFVSLIDLFHIVFVNILVLFKRFE